jgi:uncharacterized protein YndB with AHSA1/START domain
VSGSRLIERPSVEHPLNVEAIMPANTVTLHRILKAPPERVYRAFVTPAAVAKWLSPRGFTCTVHEQDARQGGAFRMTFTNFSTGRSHSFGGEYLELVPGQRLRYVDRFDDPNLPGEMIATITLDEVPSGTQIHIIQEGIPDVIPVDACYLGWQESLVQLADLVEPSIPDE